MSSPPPPSLILESGPGAPSWNMALDEALLISASDRNAPVLRLYGWTEPAATFGYSQRHSEVATRTRLRPLIRRPTGGGIVPHDRDWTYSLVIPPTHPWYRLHALESYRTIHEWVIRAFAQIGIHSELAPCCRKEIPGACFEGYEQFDVLYQGRKIAGAAQRRNRLGLLIQGSVQPPPQSLRSAWESAMPSAAPTGLLPSFATLQAPPSLLDAARQLSETKYATDAYNRSR